MVMRFPAHKKYLLALTFVLTMMSVASAQRGELELIVQDQTEAAMPAVVIIKTSRGKAVFPRKAVRVGDGFCIGGRVMLELYPGDYEFEINRGPEFRRAYGGFKIERGATDTKLVTLKRIRDLTEEGWYSSDLAVFAEPEHAPLILNAADLQLANLVTWTNDRNHWEKEILPAEPVLKLESGRTADLVSGADWRGDGGLLIANWPTSLSLDDDEAFPSPLATLKYVKSKKETFVAALDAASWDLPIWISTGKLDAIGVASPVLTSRPTKLLKGSRPKPKKWKAETAAKFWSEEIYFHLLNSGLRIPPSACSAAGANDNVPGYNRVYVHCGNEFTHERWLDYHKRGRVVITNSPLLRVTANNYLPGHVFRSNAGQSVTIDLAANLSLSEKAYAIEIIKNGELEKSIALNEWAKKNGKLPKLTFNESGWFMLRVVTVNADAHRFASTGPFYVEFDGKPRVSKYSAQFFVDWVYERARILSRSRTERDHQLLRKYVGARDFWKQILDSASAP